MSFSLAPSQDRIVADVSDADVPWTMIDASRWLMGGLVMTAAFLNTLDLNTGGSESEKTVGLDGVVALKLLCAAAAAAIGLVAIAVSPRVRRALVSPPGFAMTLLGVVFLATSLVSLPQTRTVCIAAAMIYCVYLVFTVASVTLLGWSRWTWCLLAGLVANIVCNWMLYLVAPDFATYEEWLPGETVFRRMGGLGHPNAIGRVAVMAALIGLAKFRGDDALVSAAGRSGPGVARGRVRNDGRPTIGDWTPWVLTAALSGLCLATIYATYSRTALVAGCAGVTMLCLDRLFSRRAMATFLVSAAAVAAGLFVTGLWTGDDVGGEVVSSLTKTGEASELTTATGRTRIWTKAVELIAQRPLTGYGLNAAPVLMKDHSLHTHNLLLHVWFSGGAVAAGLTVFLLFWNVAFGLTDSAPMVRAVSGYLLVSGVFEDTVLDTFAGPSTLLWLAVMMVPTLRSFRRRDGGSGWRDDGFGRSSLLVEDQAVG